MPGKKHPALSKTSALTVVLLPGLDGTGRFFAKFITQLPPDWETRVIAYPRTGRQDYAYLADYVARQLPDTRPWVLIAESFGGPLALQISTRMGANLNALVLCATFLRNPRPYLSWLAPILLRESILNRRPPKWLLRYLLADPDTDAGLLDDLRAVLDELPPRVLLQRLHSILAVDVSSQLRVCQPPVLHLYATRDRLLPASANKALGLLRPDLRSIGIDGPHFLLQTRPRECLEHIGGFLQSLGVVA